MARYGVIARAGERESRAGNTKAIDIAVPRVSVKIAESEAWSEAVGSLRGSLGSACASTIQYLILYVCVALQ